MDDAFAEAQKPGGKHHGFYTNNKDLPSVFLRRGIRSLEKRIREHEEKIRNPTSVSGFSEKDPSEQDYFVRQHWPDEITNWREQIVVLQGVLERRNERSS